MGVIELAARDAIQDIKNSGATFTSWDRCMQKAYCKWPVIAAIVIGSLIVLSILFCLVRCLCCGMECCCGCFACFNSCCPSPRRGRKSKYADEPTGPSRFAPNPYHGYQPTPHAPPAYEAPKFAQFETGAKKYNEDSLPAMPSWDHAATRKVENHTAQDDVEMNNLHENSSQKFGTGAAAAAIAGAGPGGRGHYSHLGANPGSPHHERPNPYGNASPTHPYGGDMGAQKARQDYNFSRPGVPAGNSYRSAHSSPYGPSSPITQGPPQGGYRNPASEDQFQSTAMAPTPQQYNTGLSSTASQPSGFSGYTAGSTTRYEPSIPYSQEAGVTHASSPTSTSAGRPPSILQAGRKPVAGSWRDI